jgi:DNA (cytosine-5)-methyltransferase 1
VKQQNLYIDIFAGCGGLSTGLFNAGWTGLFAVEKNIDAFSTLKYNLIDNKKHFQWPEWLLVKEHDINEIIKNNKEDLVKLKGKVALVAGGPPCQGFSMAGKRDKNDQRNTLVKSYIKFIKLVMPETIIFENVHGFTVNFKNKKGTKKYSTYVENALKRLGYKTTYKVVDMSEYGIPQRRKRFILIAMQNMKPESVFLTLEKNKTKFCSDRNLSTLISVGEAICDLEKGHGTIASPDSKGFLAGEYGKVASNYQILMRKDKDSSNFIDSHRFVNHRSDTIKLHKELLKVAPRGKRITPSDKCVKNLNRRGVTVLDFDLPAPTITSIPDEILHYKEPRILTVREHARIQSFPDWYEFKGKYTSGGERRKREVPRYTQVGNAVPPLFAEQIGLALLEVLKNGSNK